MLIPLESSSVSAQTLVIVSFLPFLFSLNWIRKAWTRPRGVAPAPPRHHHQEDSASFFRGRSVSKSKTFTADGKLPAVIGSLGCLGIGIATYLMWKHMLPGPRWAWPTGFGVLGAILLAVAIALIITLPSDKDSTPPELQGRRETLNQIMAICFMLAVTSIFTAIFTRVVQGAL